MKWLRSDLTRVFGFNGSGERGHCIPADGSAQGGIPDLAAAPGAQSAGKWIASVAPAV
jgi:hypothetical protein